ncbi:MAG: diphthine synthase [Thermoplasmataceae archaeon]
MIHVLGLGLRGIDSVTLGEMRIISKCEKIYFETYTSISPEKTASELSSITSKHVFPLGREDVENSTALLTEAKDQDICIIVTGDPLAATTHNQLRMDAIAAGVSVNIVENASILTTLPGKAGLLPYRMGPPVSLPFLTDRFNPRSVLDKMGRNRDMGLHTIILLDLKENRTMYPEEAFSYLNRLEEKYEAGVVKKNSLFVVASKVSQIGESLCYGQFENLLKLSWKSSPSSLIFLADLTEKELEFIYLFCKKME